MIEDPPATTEPPNSPSDQSRRYQNLRRYLLWGGLLAVLAWVAATLVPRGGSVPAFATPEAIEATYPQLLDRLAKVAMQGTFATEIAGNDQLVAAPEILEATVGTQNSRTVVGNKRLNYSSRSFFFPKQPAINQPVVNQYSYALTDGRQVLALSFEAKVLDSAGQAKLIQILFDPVALENRLQTNTAR